MEFLSSRDHKPPMKGIINKVLYNMLYFFRCIIISTFKLSLSFIDTIFGKKRNVFEKSCHDRQPKNILSIFPRFFPVSCDTRPRSRFMNKVYIGRQFQSLSVVFDCADNVKLSSVLDSSSRCRYIFIWNSLYQIGTDLFCQLKAEN